VDDLLIWEQLTQFFGEIYQPFFGIFLWYAIIVLKYDLYSVEVKALCVIG
jgi:hypothetical protein